MSIMYCEKHSRRWDSDFLEECPECEHEPAATSSDTRSPDGVDYKRLHAEEIGEFNEGMALYGDNVEFMDLPDRPHDQIGCGWAWAYVLDKRPKLATSCVENTLKLLAMSQCPNCDGSGAIARPVHRCCGHILGTGECCGYPYVDVEPEQCQWCFEKNALLAQAQVPAEKTP